MTPEVSDTGRRNLRLIVIGQGVSYLGDYLAFFLALPVFVRDRTESAESLGLLFAAETAAILIFGFIAGVLLDRAHLKRAVVLADLARALAFGLLALAVVSDVEATWMAFAVAFLVGSMGTVFDAGLQSYMPVVLRDEALPTANAGIEFVRSLAMTLGFMAGGLVIAWSGGIAGAFALDSATYLVSVLALLAVREIRPRARAPHEPAMKALTSGVAHLWHTRPLRWATAAAAVTNFAFAPLVAVMTLYAKVELGIVDDRLLGVFFAIFSAIGAVGGVMAAVIMRRLGLGRSVILGGFLFGMGALAAGLVDGWWAVAPFGIATAGVAVNQAAFVTLRQRLTPPDRLGRVVAASRTIAFTGLPLGAYFGAVLGDAVGLRPLFIASGTIITVVSLLLVTGPLGNRGVTLSRL
ncbi:MAG: MFS transporter [Acidimicrobiia bacterium]